MKSNTFGNSRQRQQRLTFDVRICLDEFFERFPPLNSLCIVNYIPYNNASSTFDLLDILLGELVQVGEVNLRNVL